MMREMAPQKGPKMAHAGLRVFAWYLAALIHYCDAEARRERIQHSHEAWCEEVFSKVRPLPTLELQLAAHEIGEVHPAMSEEEHARKCAWRDKLTEAQPDSLRRMARELMDCLDGDQAFFIRAKEMIEKSSWPLSPFDATCAVYKELVDVFTQTTPGADLDND